MNISIDEKCLLMIRVFTLRAERMSKCEWAPPNGCGRRFGKSQSRMI
jgi:hypothetical protein